MCRSCIVCGLTDAINWTRLNENQRNMLFIKRGISVLPGAWCCDEHLYKKQLSYEALNQISTYECDCILVNSNQLNQMLVNFRSLYRIKRFSIVTILCEWMMQHITILQAWRKVR